MHARGPSGTGPFGSIWQEVQEHMNQVEKWTDLRAKLPATMPDIGIFAGPRMIWLTCSDAVAEKGQVKTSRPVTWASHVHVSLLFIQAIVPRIPEKSGSS